MLCNLSSVSWALVVDQAGQLHMIYGTTTLCYLSHISTNVVVGEPSPQVQGL